MEPARIARAAVQVVTLAAIVADSPWAQFPATVRALPKAYCPATSRRSVAQPAAVPLAVLAVVATMPLAVLAVVATMPLAVSLRLLTAAAPVQAW